MLYLKLLLFAVAITAIIMVIYAIKRKQKDNRDFSVETDSEKYKKMKPSCTVLHNKDMNKT